MGKQSDQAQSKQGMAVIAIYCSAVLIATTGSKTGNVCITKHFGAFM